MKKIILIVIIIIAAILVLGFWRVSNKSNSQDQTATVSSSDSVVLFYGKECPHCQIVEEFLTKNNVADKVQFKQAEIFHNKANSEIFVEKNRICGVTDESKMGVPMLWADGKCFVGQDEVMKYFQDKISATSNQ